MKKKMKSIHTTDSSQRAPRPIRFFKKSAIAQTRLVQLKDFTIVGVGCQNFLCFVNVAFMKSSIISQLVTSNNDTSNNYT